MASQFANQSVGRKWRLKFKFPAAIWRRRAEAESNLFLCGIKVGSLVFAPNLKLKVVWNQN